MFDDDIHLGVFHGNDPLIWSYHIDEEKLTADVTACLTSHDYIVEFSMKSAEGKWFLWVDQCEPDNLLSVLGIGLDELNLQATSTDIRSNALVILELGVKRLCHLLNSFTIPHYILDMGYVDEYVNAMHIVRNFQKMQLEAENALKVLDEYS